MIPQTFEQWRHCIVVDCGLALSQAYVSERIAAWRDDGSAETVRFRRLYGDEHWRSVLGWFERAARELGHDVAGP